MKYILKLLATLIIFTTMTLAQASPVDWEIKFFNEDGNIVGDGEFSYDPDTLETFSVLYDVFAGPEFITVSTSFTHLNWRLGGAQYGGPHNKGFGATWWDGGSIVSSGGKGSPLSAVTQFTIQAGGHGPDAIFLSLGFGPTNDLSGTGSWRQLSSILTIPSDSGTWSANALIPIPSTILLFGSGLLTLTMTKRKKFRNQ